jgi:hypothetical protein
VNHAQELLKKFNNNFLEKTALNNVSSHFFKINICVYKKTKLNVVIVALTKKTNFVPHNEKYRFLVLSKKRFN